MSRIVLPAAAPAPSFGIGHDGADQAGDLPRQERGDSIADLLELVCPRAAKQVIVGKGLETGGLPDGQAAA